MKEKKKILIFGAGVIGSIYGGKLLSAGHDVTFYARGKRLDELKNKGLILENSITGKTESFPVKTIDKIKSSGFYDIVIVALRKNQLTEALPVISETRSKAVIFMVNNPLGFSEYEKAAGKRHAVAAFPAAGGSIDNGTVSYYIPEGISRIAQASTFGELSGEITAELKSIADIFSKAGFNTALSRDMNSWQKTHVAVVSPMANAVYKYNGSNYDLSKSYSGVKEMILAVREGFSVLEKLGFKITPMKLGICFKIPLFILVPFFRKLLGTKLAEVVISRHALNARDEMKQLADEFIILRNDSGLKTPYMDELISYI
jgi:2-dehydropantoate 2-reductase